MLAQLAERVACSRQFRSWPLQILDHGHFGRLLVRDPRTMAGIVSCRLASTPGNVARREPAHNVRRFQSPTNGCTTPFPRNRVGQFLQQFPHQTPCASDRDSMIWSSPTSSTESPRLACSASGFISPTRRRVEGGGNSTAVRPLRAHDSCPSREGRATPRVVAQRASWQQRFKPAPERSPLVKGLSVFSGCAPALLVAALVVASRAVVVILDFSTLQKRNSRFRCRRLGVRPIHRMDINLLQRRLLQTWNLLRT